MAMFNYNSDVPVSPEEIDENEKQEIIDKLAKGIVNRGLTAPAIMFLESIKPMNYIGSQIMVFFEPVVLTIFTIKNYRKIALIFEERGSIERVLESIEKFENEKKENKKEEFKKERLV